jgi:hypothetical protein
MSDDTKRFSPPPLKPGQTLVMMLAFRDGQAYMAPAGSTLQNPDAWIAVDSLESIASRLGLRWES